MVMINNDWSSNLLFGFKPKPAFYLDPDNTIKFDNSESFIVKLKRIVDKLYMTCVIKKYQSDMLDKIIYFCESNLVDTCHVFKRELSRYYQNDDDIVDIVPPLYQNKVYNKQEFHTTEKLSVKEQQKLHPNWWWKN